MWIVNVWGRGNHWLNMEWLLYLQCVVIPCIIIWFTFLSLPVVVYFKLIHFVLFFFLSCKNSETAVWISFKTCPLCLDFVRSSEYVLTLWLYGIYHTRWPPLPGKFPQVNFQWVDDEVCLVIDQHAELDFYSASSLKQQSADRHVAPLGHIVLITSQPVFALSP